MSIIYSKLYYYNNKTNELNELNEPNKTGKRVFKDLIKNHNYNSTTGTAFIKP